MGPEGTALQVEVVFALPDRCWRWRGVLPLGACVQDALDASGVAATFPEIGSAPSAGIFGALVELEQPLRNADRVEIYRPLRCDPMEARRRRAGEAVKRRK